MNIRFHGGHCCGIKHIDNLGYNPDCIISLKKGQPFRTRDEYAHDYDNDDDYNPDLDGDCFESSSDFFTEEAPKETAKERFLRLVDFIYRKRGSSQLIEVTIMTEEDSWLCQSRWVPVLEDAGFKVVSEFRNVNSGNFIHVWHKIV